MELIQHSLPAKIGTDILIMPLGDIQFSGRDSEVAMGMLKRHVQWGVDHGAYFIGMGDYVDFTSPSNRLRLQHAALYDTAIQTIDDKAHSLVEDLYRQALKPSKGRWLGLLEGHHYHKYREGITTDQELAKMLGAPFLGTSAFVKLMLQMGGGRRGGVTIWCHHGVGGGGTLGAPLNKLEKVALAFEADIYLIGHHHKKVAGPIDRIEMVTQGHRKRASLVHRTKLIACTGSFLKGYTAGARDGLTPRGGYVEQKMLNPVSLGGVLVKVQPRWTDKRQKIGFMPDISVSL